MCTLVVALVFVHHSAPKSGHPMISKVRKLVRRDIPSGSSAKFPQLIILICWSDERLHIQYGNVFRWEQLSKVILRREGRQLRSSLNHISMEMARRLRFDFWLRDVFMFSVWHTLNKIISIEANEWKKYINKVC